MSKSGILEVNPVSNGSQVSGATTQKAIQNPKRHPNLVTQTCVGEFLGYLGISKIKPRIWRDWVRLTRPALFFQNKTNNIAMFFFSRQVINADFATSCLLLFTVPGAFRSLLPNDWMQLLHLRAYSFIETQFQALFTLDFNKAPQKSCATFVRTCLLSSF